MVNDEITIFLKKSKTPAHIQRALDQILYDLERYGRTITSNGYESRYLSYKMRKPKNDKQIYFGWNKFDQKSMISLKPGAKIERVSDTKVRLIYEQEFEN